MKKRKRKKNIYICYKRKKKGRQFHVKAVKIGDFLLYFNSSSILNSTTHSLSRSFPLTLISIQPFATAFLLFGLPSMSPSTAMFIISLLPPIFVLAATTSDHYQLLFPSHLNLADSFWQHSSEFQLDFTVAGVICAKRICLNRRHKAKRRG